MRVQQCVRSLTMLARSQLQKKLVHLFCTTHVGSLAHHMQRNKEVEFIIPTKETGIITIILHNNDTMTGTFL